MHSPVWVPAGFALYGPKVHGYYKCTTQALRDKYPSLADDFPESIWHSRSYNGDKNKRASAYMHRDSANLAYGWCAIQALGDFDHTQGGHLALRELGIVTQFPGGSAIIAPSSVVEHGVTPVTKHETRTSLIHFSPAGIFRHVEYDFCTC